MVHDLSQTQSMSWSLQKQTLLFWIIKAYIYRRTKLYKKLKKAKEILTCVEDCKDLKKLNMTKRYNFIVTNDQREKRKKMMSLMNDGYK